MKIPKRLQPLVDDGLIDEVISRLMSGKEADIFIVRCGDHIRCAKVYKDAIKRSFKKAAQYQEGRKVRNARQARAMEKRSNYGRQQQEEIWQNAEIDALSRLANAGVRVPETFGCVDGVLLMELVTDDEGDVAPRLGDVTMSEQQALEDHALMMHYIMLMLCAGVVHGDLSEFNVLVDDYGPVVIDLPQAVNASANNNAQEMFARDVNNMRRYYGEFAPALLHTEYAKEMWALFEEGNLTPNSRLTGIFEDANVSADVDAVLEEIQAVMQEEQERQERIREADEDL
ncbi:serine/threonine protein kinase involved in cell cycle control [Spongiibacter sp. IMCC21906]|uniref:PA4780 family RIO1-like protein kinase n=1 Tax=Spongiibacter sp. IMCC21906 TaxID=1620392 RepID=UPI00062DF906|nr:PA4780 family RIO1-like protein kinase [Spongiibacter sp. IMCC21906]AKH68208.1 serine/threonine protein kinase involved in cell cycle control [Spongiibacter sp. IMCC21906]